MSQYDYSIKGLLSNVFGGNTLFEMRKPHESAFENVAPGKLTALCWQYADEQAVSHFTEDKFLLDTVLYDDYIAYIVQRKNMKYVYLMFMLTEEDSPFRINTEYAISLLDEWKAKSYEPRILSECIAVEHYNDNNNRFRFRSHLGEGKGFAIYRLETVNAEKIPVFDTHTCWQEYYKKLVSVFGSYNLKEYKCLFEPDVEITSGTKENRIVLSKGIPSVKDLLEENSPVISGYKEFSNTGIFSSVILAGGKELTLYVNRRNLISEISLASQSTNGVIINEPVKQQSLIALVPSLLKVHALEPVKMHGFVIQLSYSDDSVRNYYLKSFEQWEVPDEITVDEVRLTKAQLQSVSVNANNGVSFDGEFEIESWQLFYQSYRQLVSEPIDDVKYESNNIVIKGVYRTPLLESKSHFSADMYWGREGECYGPARALLDDFGKRISDVSLYSIYNDSSSKTAASRVCVEPTGKYGFINADGSWLAPPIYVEAKEFHKGCTEVKRIVNGETINFLLTTSGRETPFNYSIDTAEFTNNRCAFSVETYNGEAPSSGYYWDYDWVKPGKWGFIDSECNIIITPRYVYAAGFYNGGGEHSVVAKFVDGSLKWGVIDLQGNETIPCVYEELYCRWGEAVAFQREKTGQYGLMDFDGNVIAEPMFNYIEAYIRKHGLITAGEDGDSLGVYSIKEERMVIPGKYDCVDYYDRLILCELANACKEDYYDYDWNLLDFSEYDSVYEDGENLSVWKDGKSGLIDWDKNVIIPPIMGYSVYSRTDIYKKGLTITEDKKLKGLSTLDGKVILPQIFTEIIIEENFAIGSVRTDTNRCICDTLYNIEGTPILEGSYRDINIHGNKITAETPYGIEHYIIMDKKSANS